MRRVSIALLAALVLSACGDKPSTMEDLNSDEVTLPNGTKIMAEAMRETIDLQRGLMFRPKLPADRGMMFYFRKEEPHTHWMYQVTFPIDIIWMNKDRQIVEISPNTPPCPSKIAHECPTYGGTVNSRYVLETNAGFIAKNNLAVGQKLNF